MRFMTLSTATKKPFLGKAVIEGKMQYTSVSAMEKFAAETEGCNLKWWYRYVDGRKEEETEAKDFGTDFHTQIEHYLSTGQDGMSEVGRAGKHLMPAPGTDLNVEYELQKNDLVYEGIWVTGKIDCWHRRGEYVDNEGKLRKELEPATTAEIIDWKSTKEIGRFTKKGSYLINTIQMAGYADFLLRRFPELKYVRLSHVYFQKKSPKHAEKRTALIPIAKIIERRNDISRLVQRMIAVARETDVEKIEIVKHERACKAYGGCSYTNICPYIRSQDPVANFLDKLNSLKKPAEPLSDYSAQRLAKKGVAATSTAPVNPLVPPEGHYFIQGHGLTVGATLPTTGETVVSNPSPGVFLIKKAGPEVAPQILPPDVPAVEKPVPPSQAVVDAVATLSPTEVVEAPKKSRGRPKKAMVIEDQSTVPDAQLIEAQKLTQAQTMMSQRVADDTKQVAPAVEVQTVTLRHSNTIKVKDNYFKVEVEMSGKVTGSLTEATEQLGDLVRNNLASELETYSGKK
jgi:hypothetical protein